ncbi:hypothetical protein [Sporosarcina cyprini]|uniref:hypothetical protein n=1 Tax=Sporosarcina cyprini TaxID=2910523 RepID=UPI001EDDB0AB|nr:hypothetical protein [Sporosarcina cyprini]MCG3089146.1 hypothetical protein [Sporosarcina cyprini]
MFGLFKDKGKRLTFVADHIEGLENFKVQERLNVTWEIEEHKLTFASIENKKKSKVNLNLNKVTDVGVATEKEITEKSKSVIGRAAVGTLLIGPLGGIIGGMSGLGNKKKEKDLRVAVINYDDKQIVLLGNNFSIGMDGFFKQLNKQIQNSNLNSQDIEL